MIRLGFFFILCMYDVGAYRIDLELEDMESKLSRSMPETHNSMGGRASASDCKKDIWILWDNSWSVGEKGFQERIRPFLKHLITSPQLNVSPEGTHIGILTFSTEAQTRVMVKLGEMLTKEELLAYLDGLKYDDVKGDGTRTGMALKVVDEKFSKHNPDNHRPDVDDVVMVFTDGEPVRRPWEDKFGERYKSSRNGEKLLALDCANSLRAKDITVVGLAVGDQDRIAKFRDDIKLWTTSDEYYFETRPEQLDSILGKLITVSCVDPGLCSCDTIIAEGYTTHGNKASVSWTEPTLKCPSDIAPVVERMVVEPSVSSPAEFDVGKHTVTYTYAYMRGPKVAKQECLLDIDVKDCKCPRTVYANAVIPEGESKAKVSWPVPKPNCPATLNSVSPPSAENGHGSFSIGEHFATYNYEHSSGSGSFTMNCPVMITVKDCKCPHNVNVNAMIPAGESKAQVSWEIPNPNCDASLTSVSPTDAENGESSFSIGQHFVTYNYEYNSNDGSFTMSCPVTITVKGKLCRGKAFNSVEQVCCCGTIYPRETGNECCGPDYYNTSQQRCCKNANLVSRQESCLYFD